MNTGLNEATIHMIQAVLRGFEDISEAILFGSRAKGTFQPSSDIDIAIKGIDDIIRVELIADKLDLLPLPYKFDIQAYANINSSELLGHINRVGVSIYSK